MQESKYLLQVRLQNGEIITLDETDSKEKIVKSFYEFQDVVESVEFFTIQNGEFPRTISCASIFDFWPQELNVPSNQNMYYNTAQ